MIHLETLSQSQIMVRILMKNSTPLNKDIEESDDGAGNSNNRCDDNKSDSDGAAACLR